MKLIFYILSVIVFTSCSTTNIYVMRHAEKEAATTMLTDVPLSTAGQLRAEAVRVALADKKIKAIYSTNYARTKATAQPLSTAIGVPVQTYDPRDTTIFSTARNTKQSMLIIGHSNTVDDLVNGITRTKTLQDLPETQYGDLYIIKKRGNKFKLQTSHVGL